MSSLDKERVNVVIAIMLAVLLALFIGGVCALFTECVALSTPKAMVVPPPADGIIVDSNAGTGYGSINEPTPVATPAHVVSGEQILSAPGEPFEMQYDGVGYTPVVAFSTPEKDPSIMVPVNTEPNDDPGPGPAADLSD